MPYSLTTNDAKLLSTTGETWASFIIDTIEVLRREGENAPKMLSIGLHARITGQPARLAGLTRVLDHLAKCPDVWIAPRSSIAELWRTQHPPPSDHLS